MKKSTRILLVAVLITTQVNAQTSKVSENRKLQVTGFAAIGRGIFKANPSAPSRFPTLELRVGAGVIKPVGKRFEIQSRLVLGEKFKREPYNKPGQGYTVDVPFDHLDELASKYSYYFIEVPIILQYNLPRPKLGISFGLNYRSFYPTEDPSYSPMRNEIGLLPGGVFRINDRMRAGIEYYFGLTIVDGASGLIDNQPFEMKARNQFGQIKFEYIFKQKDPSND